MLLARIFVAYLVAQCHVRLQPAAGGIHVVLHLPQQFHFLVGALACLCHAGKEVLCHALGCGLPHELLNLVGGLGPSVVHGFEVGLDRVNLFVQGVGFFLEVGEVQLAHKQFRLIALYVLAHDFPSVGQLHDAHPQPLMAPIPFAEPVGQCHQGIHLLVYLLECLVALFHQVLHEFHLSGHHLATGVQLVERNVQLVFPLLQRHNLLAQLRDVRLPVIEAVETLLRIRSILRCVLDELAYHALSGFTVCGGCTVLETVVHAAVELPFLHVFLLTFGDGQQVFLLRLALALHLAQLHAQVEEERFLLLQFGFHHLQFGLELTDNLALLQHGVAMVGVMGGPAQRAADTLLEVAA